MRSIAQEAKRLLVFGPQALSARGSDFRSLQLTVKQLSWIADTITDLPSIWKDFVKEFPKYGVILGEDLLRHLIEWTKTGDLTLSANEHLPNIILSPLVVITHITEYLKYLDTATAKSSYGSSIETLGFCIGFLSALAVSISKDTKDIERYGANAIRLAMIIGGIVDVQDVLDTEGPSKSLATAWNSAKAAEELKEILSRFPEAYVSVSYDDQRATITTAFKSTDALQARLRDAGIVANEIGLFGRFHHQQYAEDVDPIINFISSRPLLLLPDASNLIYQTRSNSGTGLITSGKLHAHALRTILLQHSNWYPTFKSITESQVKHQRIAVIVFGPEPCVPPSILREIKQNVIHASDIQPVSVEPPSALLPQQFKDDDIAVVGMSLKVAGADDTDEFWDLLCSGKSQHREVPRNRIKFDNEWREVDPKRKYYGNFLNDHDVFDQKFFKKSAREAASTDPQQRILLHVAYQALEQAGYFTSPDQDKKIGCFIGECAADYADNVACHQPNAFTATGNLKSFIAGKVSHYFGWTGTGLTLDTACSSSLVAVHLACKSILSGECNAALAGGVNMMNSALWFQNLAAASFLSPTGQCKPFDANADGYCRGEAVGVVFLKKMSAAIANGDQIIGTISSTGVSQNQNCTPIFVPNAPSLSSLFENVIQNAQIDPKKISIVEAHGTGTQVGDPAEYDSIRRVLGGANLRSKPLSLGSVKGLVGHTEASSGVVSLIKTLLMIQNKTIPPQASYKSPNPHLNATPDDKMQIITKQTTWEDDYRAALINNYGASGSNASAVITEAPRLPKSATSSHELPVVDYPFHIFGKDDRAIRDYCAKLVKSLETKGVESLSIANLSFNICRQSNPTLDRALVFTSRSVKQLIEKLDAFQTGDINFAGTVVQPKSRSVVLCFGGQISTYVGLNREVYENVKVLATYLDQCDYVCRSLGCESIYPGIFQRSPIDDIVKLQAMLFSIQYACGRSWIDSGIQPVAIVGHSFGELTSLCISGVLSLEDTLKMIVGRATIIKESWGSEKGTMMAIEADQREVEKLLAETLAPCEEAGQRAPTIACLNGPRSFTIAGSSRAIDIASHTISKNPAYSKFRYKKLNVTNAFHSTLVEPLMSDLEQVGQTLQFNSPSIHLERATEFYSERLGPKYVADHMRNPVFFNHAVQRISKKYPDAIFVEAGSNSTITNMASRALGSPSGSHFQPIHITTDNGFQLLVNSTVSLWKEGLIASFWAHSRLQTYEYSPMILPAYQFEKSRHWVEPVPPPTSSKQDLYGHIEKPKGLWSFFDYKDEKKRAARFRINTETERYKELVSGHIIAQTAPICPATVEVDIAIEALISLYPDFSSSGLQPRICNVDNQSPICIDTSRSVWLDVDSQNVNPNSWSWQIISDAETSKASTVHVTGQINFVSVDNAEWQLEFSRYERLIGHKRCVGLLNSDDADDIIQGRNIYRSFGEVVDYSAPYRGLQKLVGKGNESAGRVVKKFSGESWLDALLSDCFSQVGGIWVNCMTEKDPGDMYIATGFEKWMRSPDVTGDYKRPSSWDVFAYHQELPSEHSYLTDMFIFDSTNGKLTEVILGVHYHKVAKATMSKILARLSGLPIAPASSAAKPSADAGERSSPAESDTSNSGSKDEKGKSGETQDIVTRTKGLLAEISGMGVEEISNNAQLADIGIDSLMGMELARELEGLFKCILPSDELMNVTDFAGLVQIIKSTLGIGDDEEGSDQEGSDSSGSDSSSTFTPSTPATTSLSDVEDNGNGNPTSKVQSNVYTGDLQLPSSTIIEAFEESRKLTDDFIVNYRCAGYMDTILPRQTQLCVALTVEAFEQLGCPIRSAKAGDQLIRISHDPQHQRLTNYLYKMLEEEARLIDTDGSKITRTAIAPPSKSSDAILDQLLRDFPDHEWANKLTHFAGSRLADVLKGDCDGIKLIFGSDEGRRLVTGLYGDSLLNKLANVQMQDIISRVASKIPTDQGPLKILELGAGTGGTTKGMVALLAKLGMPVEYTFTDLSGSFVAAARKTFKEYPFMKYKVHDIEKPPVAELVGSQHIIIASNAMHATHNLEISTANVRKALRPDGFLMMLEMTSPVFWVDLIFGLFEGWWLFDDGREHAIAHQTIWERIMRSAGYGHIDWTDGNSPELNIQRVIIALASGPQYGRQPVAPLPKPENQLQPAAGRKAAVDEYIRKYTEGFCLGQPIKGATSPSSYEKCVLITGATGSLGSHLLAHVTALPNVKTVVCLNRRSGNDANARQQKALEDRGILLDAASQSKLQVFQATTSKPMLGLENTDYEELLGKVTHIVHNAWPMTGKRPLSGLESQFQVMRNLIDFARDISARRPEGAKVTLQLISSIAVVGHYPLWTGNVVVPEERMTLESVLPNGYGDAKFVCERMLDETLHKFPDQFRVMSVRPGQIAGSKVTGYWNAMEHLSFLFKSSQTLNVLPDFDGDLCWTPVDDVAGTCSDLLISERQPYPVYHIDNPVRQPWREMIPLLAELLDIPSNNIVPFKEWVRRVRAFPGSVEWDNPAALLIDFLDDNFLRMSCGGLLLGTTKSCEHSPTLAAVGPVSVEVTQKYIQSWKNSGFLH
ncbi:polyketide synthase, putative [Talaromyces stipitatus ATCC 10500]|uniref:Polyketide synthase, putative n=1 Tax=Talaromyces stipitatus (strain ATCC 10500 / CBS 375.48 / QM 6759 / NRRL 1006) TaxID=441959 RepID=B8LX33_TALSN|nr:polyketide synthase, putative [Talaromyces stipitatus ATCC 10500]EED22683.1 polyketide synthase, putative [Talaromyces stipitatus ATCC 10500]